MRTQRYGNGFGYWDWTVNVLYQDFPPGNDYRIKVSHLDHPDLFVFSDPFSLINCPLVDFTIGPDTSIFPDEGLTLIPTDGFENYEWLPYNVSDQIVYLTGGSMDAGVNEIICNATYVEGCLKSDTILVTVLPQPCLADASFTYEQHSGDNNCDTYTFTYANPSWHNYQLIWDFGDGTVVEAQSVEIEHTFPEPGTYEVTCRHFDPDYPDCKDSVSVSLLIASAPLVGFTQHISVDTLTLIASIEGAGGYLIEWVLDGTPLLSVDEETLQNNDTLVYVFPKNGVYQIEVQLTDTLGAYCRYTGFSSEIRIADIPPCKNTTGSFAFRPLEGYGSGNRSEFRFRGEVNSLLDCYEVSWNLGDGSEELTDTLDFTYNFKPGTYYVTMKLNNCGGCESSYTDTVVAGERLEPGLLPMVQACDQTQLDAMEGEIGYFWNDSTTNRSLLVDESGEYWVMLVDKQGFYRSDTSRVTIFVSPLATIDSIPLLCSSDERYVLTEGKPAGGIYNGFYISGNEFDIQEAGAGFHQITYYFEDENGCSDSVSSLLEVEATAPGRRLIQNQVFSGATYLTGDSIIVGNQVDLSNPFGPVWIQNGAEAYFKAGTVISLKQGIHIHQGSRFRAVILPLSCVEVPEKSLFLVDSSSKTEFGISAVPNPTTGLVKFIARGNPEERFHFKVYNNRGQLIINRPNEPIGQTLIDLSDYPQGLYYVKLLNSDSKTGIKILKR